MIWPFKIDRTARITTTIGVIGMVWVLCGPYASLRISRMEYFNQFLGELKGSTVTSEEKVAASIGLWFAFAVVPIWTLYLVIPRAKGKERIASNQPEQTRIFLRRPYADEWTIMAVPAAVILLSALSDTMMWGTLFILPFLMIASGLSFASLLASVAIQKDRKAMNLSGVCWVLIFFAITWCVFSLDVYKHASKHRPRLDSHLNKEVPHIAALWVGTADGMSHSAGMARKLRLQYPGGIHHLMNRGDRRERVFSGVASQGRPGEDRPGAAVAAGNDHAAQVDLRPAGDGVLGIRHSEAF